MSTIYVSPTGLASSSGATPADPKSLSAGMSAAASGDTISMADGVYARLDVTKTLNFVATTTPTAKTVPGFTGGHPAQQNRGVVINEATIAAADCTFADLWFKWNKWVDTTAGQTFESVYGAAAPFGIVIAKSGGHAPVFTRCEFSWGYGPTQDPFDTSAYYPEFQSGAYASIYPAGNGNVTGHGDAYQSWWIRDDIISGSAAPANTNIPNGRAYNTIVKGPRGFYTSNASLRSAQFYACHFHDLSAGMLYYCDKSLLVVDQCWFERIYLDAMAGGLGTTGLASGHGLQVTRSIIEQPFSDAHDSGNPHSDFLQHFSNLAIANPASPTRYGNVRIERNFALVRPGERGYFQYLFLQGPSGHDDEARGLIYWNPIVRDNASLQTTADEGLGLYGVRDGVVEHNAFLSNPGLVSPAAARIALTEQPYLPPGAPLVRNNITETVTIVSSAKQQNNVAAGKAYAAISAASLMQGPFNLTGASDTASNWYAAMARQSAYAAKGPRYASLEDLVGPPLSGADVPLFLGWADQRQCALSTVVTSDGSTIRGPLGGVVTVSTDIGEFRVEDMNGAVLTDWGSSPLGGVPVGAVLRVRHTTSANYTDVKNQTITLTHATAGSAGFTFSTVTLSNVVLPTVSLPTTVSVGNTTQTNMGAGTSSKRFTFAMRFIPTQTPTGGSYALYGDNRNVVPLNIRLLSSGKIRIVAKSAGNTSLVGSWDSNLAVTNGSEYLLIISVDTTSAGACTARAWNLTDGVTHLTWGAPGVTDDYVAFGQNHWATISFAPSTGAAPKVNFVYLDNVLNIDANSSAAFLAFSNAYLGPNGEGPTGALPLLFVAGPTSDWTAASGINRGTGLKLFASGTGLADVESPVRPYPPVLDLRAEAQTAGPYAVNDPIDIKVYPQGYGVGCSATPASDKSGTWSASPLSVPAGKGGALLTFTPTQTGVHTITFTNSAGYNNPTALSITVI